MLSGTAAIGAGPSGVAVHGNLSVVGRSRAAVLKTSHGVFVYTTGGLFSHPQWPPRWAYQWFKVYRCGDEACSDAVDLGPMKCFWIHGPPILRKKFRYTREEVLSELADWAKSRFPLSYVEKVLEAHRGASLGLLVIKDPRQAVYLWLAMPRPAIYRRSIYRPCLYTYLAQSAIAPGIPTVVVKEVDDKLIEAALAEIDGGVLSKLYHYGVQP